MLELILFIIMVIVSVTVAFFSDYLTLPDKIAVVIITVVPSGIIMYIIYKIRKAFRRKFGKNRYEAPAKISRKQEKKNASYSERVSPEEQGSKKCLKCGNEIENGMIFCDKCGTRIQ